MLMQQHGRGLNSPRGGVSGRVDGSHRVGVQVAECDIIALLLQVALVVATHGVRCQISNVYNTEETIIPFPFTLNGI